MYELKIGIRDPEGKLYDILDPYEEENSGSDSDSY